MIAHEFLALWVMEIVLSRTKESFVEGLFLTCVDRASGVKKPCDDQMRPRYQPGQLRIMI